MKFLYAVAGGLDQRKSFFLAFLHMWCGGFTVGFLLCSWGGSSGLDWSGLVVGLWWACGGLAVGLRWALVGFWWALVVFDGLRWALVSFSGLVGFDGLWWALFGFGGFWWAWVGFGGLRLFDVLQWPPSPPHSYPQMRGVW